MCAKKRHTSGSDFLQYLKDNLSRQERHELERGLEADPFEKEAMEGLESIDAGKAEEDLLKLHSALEKRLGRRNRRAWYSIAATAASILIVGTIFLNIYDLNPDDKSSEPLTEKTFRTLDAEEEMETIPEAATPEKSPERNTPREETLDKAADIPKATEPYPPEKKGIGQEEEQDLRLMEVIADDELEPEVPIVAVEAVPKEAAHMDAAPEEAASIEAASIEAAPIEAAPMQKSISSERSKRAARTEISSERILEEKVSGIVLSSEDLSPLPGASISIRGTNSGTVADMEGRFTLPADDSQTTVVASFIGMKTEEYQLSSENDNRLLMQPDDLTLDEIVVVAQGSGMLSGVSMDSVGNTQPDDATPSYTPAQPLDGYRTYKKYMEENMLYPADYTPGDREVVILRFNVLDNGSISGMETLRSPGEAYTKEAIRLIMEGPEWTPAKITTGPIEEQVRIRIVFKKQ